jgi:hypothetical protein
VSTNSVPSKARGHILVASLKQKPYQPLAGTSAGSHPRCCTRAWLGGAALIFCSCFTCKSPIFEVEPRGFEPLTSAVQRRTTISYPVLSCR